MAVMNHIVNYDVAIKMLIIASNPLINIDVEK
jgi:hypothetical protein